MGATERRERKVWRNDLGQVGRGRRPSGDGEGKPEDKGVRRVAPGAPFPAFSVNGPMEIVKCTACAPIHGSLA